MNRSHETRTPSPSGRPSLSQANPMCEVKTHRGLAVQQRFRSVRRLLCLLAPIVLLTAPLGAQPKMDNQWRCMPAPNAAMTYMLQPNQNFITLGVPFPTNQFGFRDRPVELKSPGTFRILCIGDSVTFGTGVKNEETFPNVLERSLIGMASPGTSFDVINAGISAYNVRNIRGLMEEFLDDLQPDLVVYTFVENDLDDSVSAGPDGKLLALDPYKTPDEPYISDDFPALWLMRKQQINKEGFFGKIFSAFDNQLATLSESPPPLLFGDHAEAQKRWDNFTVELTRIRDLCHAQGAPLLLYSFALSHQSEPLVERLDQVAGGLGLPTASTLSIFSTSTYMSAHSLGYDPHCNTLGHRLMADRLLCFLLDQKALPTTLAGGTVPHTHYNEPVDPVLSENLRRRALQAPQSIDLQSGEGAMGVLGGIDPDGRMARYALFRVAGPGNALTVQVAALFAAQGEPQTLSLEVEGQAVGGPVALSNQPSSVTFPLPPQFSNRDIEIKLVAGGKAWLPSPAERLEGKGAQTLQLIRIERANTEF